LTAPATSQPSRSGRPRSVRTRSKRPGQKGVDAGRAAVGGGDLEAGQRQEGGHRFAVVGVVLDEQDAAAGAGGRDGGGRRRRADGGREDGDGQPHAHAGAVADAAVEIDDAAVAPHDAPGDGQAETLGARTGGEEGIERASADDGRHAGAGVADDEGGVVAVDAELERDGARFAAGLQRVVAELAEQLVELAGGAEDGRAVVVVVAGAERDVDADAGRRAGAQLVGGLGDERRQRHRRKVAIAPLAAELLHAPRGRRAVERHGAQPIERARRRLRVADERHERAGLRQDGVEHVVEVVGDAERHVAERAHAFGADELVVLALSRRRTGHRLARRAQPAQRVADAAAEQTQVDGVDGRDVGDAEQRQQAGGGIGAIERRQLEGAIAGAVRPGVQTVDAGSFQRARQVVGQLGGQAVGAEPFGGGAVGAVVAAADEERGGGHAQLGARGLTGAQR
jgi:hypothetical protein